MKKYIYYCALGMQLFGITAVGLCLFSGLHKGDYGRLELVQFVGGSFLFYVAQYIKRVSSSQE